MAKVNKKIIALLSSISLVVNPITTRDIYYKFNLLTDYSIEDVIQREDYFDKLDEIVKNTEYKYLVESNNLSIDNKLDSIKEEIENSESTINDIIDTIEILKNKNYSFDKIEEYLNQIDRLMSNISVLQNLYEKVSLDKLDEVVDLDIDLESIKNDILEYPIIGDKLKPDFLSRYKKEPNNSNKKGIVYKTDGSIYSLYNSIVAKVDTDSEIGTYVLTALNSNIVILYTVDSTNVTKGEILSQGDIIGKGGKTYMALYIDKKHYNLEEILKGDTK